MIMINGKKYKGNSVSIVNNVVKIDGNIISGTKSDVEGILHVKVEGKVSSIISDCSISCNNVDGDIRAGGSISCDNVYGNVNAGGSVNCDNVSGDVTAGG